MPPQPNNSEKYEEGSRRRSPWDIIFGFSGLLAVLATVVVAGISYKQSLQIQALQTQSAADIEKTKSLSALAVQKQAGESSLTETQLKNAMAGQLESLKGQRELELNQRDNSLTKYINEENVRLGRYSKQSDVDLKLVEVSTDLLKTPSTQSNLALRAWAVDVVNSHSNVKMGKEATDEAIAGPIVGTPVDVIVNSHYSYGMLTYNCKVMYGRPGATSSFEFPLLTHDGVSETQLSSGAYEFWLLCPEGESSKKQRYIQTSPEKLEFVVPAIEPGHIVPSGTP